MFFSDILKVLRAVLYARASVERKLLHNTSSPGTETLRPFAKPAEQYKVHFDGSVLPLRAHSNVMAVCPNRGYSE